MSTDPVADMLTRIRNANTVGHSTVSIPCSKLKVELAKLLKAEGYINDYDVQQVGKFDQLKINLKYREEREPVITGLKKVSKPGLRVYTKAKNMPKVYDGLGIAVVSTNRGLISDRKARKENVGGEVLCYVW
ncbi:MAG: 30S ribosomal protein S8 [Vampirovibrionia bacterium]